MTITVNHSTPADASFSTTGAAAWDASHVFSGTVPIANGGTNAIDAPTALTNLGAYPASNPDGFTSNTGTVTGVTGTAPVVSSGGTAPAISIPKATNAVDGYLSATDWSTFNNKQPAGSYLTAITADAPLSGSGTSGSHLIISQATTSTNGYLSSTDWNTFNSKGNGTVTSVTGTAPVVSSGGATPAISMAAATGSVNGYLTSTDWTTFNGKQTLLVSGTNIKTVNGSTLLGSGDLTVSASAGGSNTQVQYNNAGALAGDSTFTYDGTTLKAAGIESASGVYASSTFTGTFTDGIVIDHVTGQARISAGASDDIVFYNGGVAGSELGHASSNGDWVFNGKVQVGLGTLIGGSANPLIEAAGSANGYVQTYVHNDLAGSSASADMAAYPDNGVDASGWIDVGITSSAYSDAAYLLTGANEGYIFMSAPSGSGTSGNLVYATDSTGSSNAHQWYVGGFGAAKSAYKMQLNATNLLVKQAIQANGVIESTTGGFKFPDASTQTTAATPFTGGTLTSQLKLAAGTASAGAAPMEFTSGTLNTTAEAGAMEYDGTAFYSSMANSTRGAIPSEQIVVLTGTNTLTSQTGVQPIFDGGGGPTNGAITLPVGTYQYELSFAMTGMSATSGSFGFGLGGTATKTFSYHSTSSKAGTSLTTGQATLQTFGSAANTALQTASTGTVGTALIKGIMRVTVTGTVIPQVSLTVASAAVVQTNSYFKVSPIGNATVATVGNWS